MQGRLTKLIASVRSSYWFVPSIMAFAAMLLGAVAVWIDARFELQWLNQLGWYQSATPAGAREVLSTVAGSMITVAGVVFSITIVALSYASSQYGPRVLTNFMSDRGNTVALGTLIATFVYCLIVLRTIHSGDDEFVPQLAVLIGLVLAICSIGVLIYFIHHVAQSIHINHVVAGIGRELLHGIDGRFPKRIGEPARGKGARPKRAVEPALPAEPAAGVKATQRGYIQHVDENALMTAAEEHGLLIRIRCQPGDFVTCERTLIEAWPGKRVDVQMRDKLCEAFIIGDKRTPYGDLHFLINELVEISARALSTGVNDPMTAVTCIDWLGAMLEEIAGRELPDPARLGEDGEVRVIALPSEFATFVGTSFGQLRDYVGADRIACLHLLTTAGRVGAACDVAQRAVLYREAAKLVEVADLHLDPPSRADVADCWAHVSLQLGYGGTA